MNGDIEKKTKFCELGSRCTTKKGCPLGNMAAPGLIAAVADTVAYIQASDHPDNKFVPFAGANGATRAHMENVTPNDIAIAATAASRIAVAKICEIYSPQLGGNSQQ